MKNIITTAALLFSMTAFAQVGINNTSPKATLDITPKTTDGSKPEGLLIPQLDGNSLKTAAYGTAQKGVIVYAKSAASPTDTKTANVTAEGYYYYDGSVWQKMNGASATDATTTSKGIVQLAGDLAGTAASPSIAGNAVNSAKIADGTVANGDLANMAAFTVKGNATNAAASPTDIVAGTDGYVLRRSGTALGFGTVDTAGITDGAVTTNKILDATVANADLATGTGGIYKGSGSLSGNTTVTQGANTLAFTSSATNGFSVDGTTLSVDGANNRVGVGTNTPYATLDITAKAPGTSPEGLLIPKLSGTDIQNGPYGTNQIGTLVYATTAPSAPNTVTAEITEAGFYYFNGTKWKKINSSGSTISYTTIADPNILGYVPSTTATASVDAPATLTVGSATATRQGTSSFGGHTYASYSTSAAVTWYQAYNAAKNMGGYLAVFTSDAEWQYVETNLLTPYTIFNTNGAWIGMAKFSWSAGSGLTPDPEMKWITGEQPNHDYSAGGTSAVRKVNWFYSPQPDNSGNNEGFVHVIAKNNGNTKTYNGYTSTHPWNDIPANSTPQGNSWGFIIEFQQ